MLATRPPPAERAALLVRRADVRRRERFPDLAAALADLHEAVELTEELAERDPGDSGRPAATEIRRNAYQLEAALFAQSGDQRARAQSLAAIARLAERAADRVESEAAAAAAWLAADEPAAALPHGARAHASLSSAAVPVALRREVLVTLGEAAWRQRAWPDVIRAYRGLLEDPGPEAHRLTTFRYRLAVAADRMGDAGLALGALRPLTDDPDATRGASPELRSHALRLFADLAERAGELAAAATALEGFAAIGGESSAAARADAVYRAGELFRRLDRGDDAIRCLETALRISDNHLPALDALEVAWRERGDLERVATILGRKVAATARQPGRQKPLLSRLGDLQDQLGRPDVALATHQRALEIDAMWRPSLRHVTLRLRDAGQVVAAAVGLAQLAGDLHGDHGVDLAIVAGERQIAAEALSELVAKLDDAQVEAIRAVARPALERAVLDNADVAAGLARLRGEASPGVPGPHSEAETHSGRVTGRVHDAHSGAASLREAAARARAAGKLDDAFATLETANHVSPGDPTVLRELVEIATELHDNPAAIRHLTDLAGALTGARRGDALLELADICYDRFDDAARGRDAMRQAAEAFGSGSRRDATLRLLAAEAGAHLAWDVTVEALLEIPAEKRTQADLAGLAIALMRAGRDADALSAIEAATAAGRFDDDGELIRQIQREIQRKVDLARSLEERATAAVGEEAAALLDEAQQLRIAIGQPGTQPLRDLAAPEGEAPKADTAPWPVRTKTKPGLPNKQVPPAPATSRPRITLPPSDRSGAEPPRAPTSTPAISVTVLDPDQDVRSSPGIALLDADHGVHSIPDLAIAASDDPAAGVGDSAVPVAIPGDEQTAPRSRPSIPAPAADADDLAHRDDSAIPVAILADEQTAPRSSPAIAVPTTDADADRAARRSSPAIAVPAADERTLAGVEASAASAPGSADDTPSIPQPRTQPHAREAPGPAASEGGAPSAPADATPAPGAPSPAPPDGMVPGAAPTAPSTLGRIRLVPRVVTRSGVSAPKPDAPAAPRASGSPSTEPDDTSGEWQSVSDPDLRSGPWLPPGVSPLTPRLTARRAAAPTREIARGPGSSGAPRPAGAATAPAAPPEAAATAGEVPASDAQAAAQPRDAAAGEPAGEPAARVPTESEPTGNESIASSDVEAEADTEADTEEAPPPGYNIAPPERPTSRIRLTSMPPELIGEAASEPPAQGIASSERPTSRIRLSSEALAAAERLAARVLAPEAPAAGLRSFPAGGSEPSEADAGTQPAPDDATAAERSPSRRLTAVFPAVTIHGLDPSEPAGEPPAPEPAPPDGDAADPRPSRRVTAVYPAVIVPAELDPSANEPAELPPAPARAAEPPASQDASTASSSPTPRRSTAAFPPVLIPPAFPAPPPDGTTSEPASSTAPASPPAAPDGSGGDAPGPRRSTAAYPAARVRPASGAPSRTGRPGSHPPPDSAAEPPPPRATEAELPVDTGAQPADADADAAADDTDDDASLSGPETVPDAPDAPGAEAAWDLPIAAETPSPPAAASPVEAARAAGAAPPPRAEPAVTPSVTITGTPEETQLALLLAAASADRDRLFAARRADPDDPALLLALLTHLGDREPAVRRELLDEVVRTSHGRALAIALHELAVLAREGRDPLRATALWTRAYETDPTYPPVWMPLADAFAASDDYAAARELYEMIAASDAYDSTRREFAAERAGALGHDASIVSGEIAPRPMTDLEEAEQLAAAEDWPGALDAAERAVAAHPDDVAALEVLERIYFASGNVTAASDAVGRQLMLVDDPAARAALWRRRARMYREALGRDVEAYRCLKEAHACSPADPEIAYQLRTAAMVRGEWQLAASLMYREIAAAAHPRDRGALHLELAMIYEQRLGDEAQAQANFEQALAFDPTIPAVKLPLARRYEAIGRTSEAARLYEEAASHARPADRAGLLEAAARCRQAAAESAEPDLAAQLDRAEAAGDLDAAHDLASQLWRAEPGHPAAFRSLANMHRASGDLAALTELTSQRVSRAETADERATAWLEVARLAEEIGALDQAARAYDLALIEDPGHISALDARGALAFRLADFATADLIYRDLGTGESVLGDDELALRRSIIAEHLGRDSEALQHAQLAGSLAPGRRDAMMRVQELATRVGELPLALAAARHVLELIPLDDDEAQLAVRFALVELLREAGQLDEAVAELEKVLRDHPVHAGAIETLAHVHMARGDWMAATRYLYQLVPLAPSPVHRAERLYQLGEAVLVHVNDVDRADDVFLRASDLDPGHVPTLRRLLDVYWRADDPGGIVEVAAELANKGALINGPTSEIALARALVAAALVGDTELAQQLQTALGDDTPRSVAEALAELVGRTGRLQLGTASTAVAELGRRGYLDLAKLRAAMARTAAANTL